MTIDDNYVFPVYIIDNVLNKINEICALHELEVFGYLVGDIFNWKHQKYVVISNQIYVEGAVHSEKFTTFMEDNLAGEFDKELSKLKEKNPESGIVGWWHSHPDLSCFLSPRDILTHLIRFQEGYQPALVVDPIRKTFKFFLLDDVLKKEFKSKIKKNALDNNGIYEYLLKKRNYVKEISYAIIR